MPELPEVETITRDLRSTILHKEITSVHIAWPRIIASPGPEEFRSCLVGQRMTSLRRRGKYIVAELSSGDCLLVHLRMTGQLLTQSPKVDKKHVHLSIEFTDGTSLYYADTRKFGRLWLTADIGPLLGGLGPEPLSPDFTGDELYARLSVRRRRIKPLLLDQHFIAGLGNIYVDESLYGAGIHPLRRANELTHAETFRLHDSIVAVLKAAIDNRGTTFSDYRDARGSPGSNQDHLRVFHKAGQPCPRCGHPIERLVVEQRGTYVCPVCQPLDAQDPGSAAKHRGANQNRDLLIRRAR